MFVGALKFGTVTGHKYTYKFYTESCSWNNNGKYGGCMNHWRCVVITFW